MTGMVFDWDNVPESEPIPGFHGRVVHSDTMTFVLWRIEAGAVLPEHSHVHEQVAFVLEGTFEITFPQVKQPNGLVTKVELSRGEFRTRRQ